MKGCWVFLSTLLFSGLVLGFEIREEFEDCSALESDRVAVYIAPGVDPDELAERHGHVNLGQIATLERHYLFQRRPTHSRDVHPPLSSSEHVHWHQPQTPRKLYRRALPTDPGFGSQWHLLNTAGGVDINVVPVWNAGNHGEGVGIAIVDDGLEITHPDFARNYNAQGSRDVNYNDDDPTPVSGDYHGTSCAGVAAAGADNGECGVGAASGASIAGIKLLGKVADDADEATALTYRYDINHIYSCSWGPYDDGKRLEGPGPLAKAAIVDAIKNGRDGKGTVYVWAGGNGDQDNDNCNYDGYANSRYTIAIGAVDSAGKRSYYSEQCAALMAVAPSSGSYNRVYTDDLLGRRGRTSTDCNEGFGGTSSAAPLAAGVMALVLKANPALTWRDVQHVVVNTARKNDPNDADWKVNGAGFHVNHKYGFGLLDAAAAVRMATSWKLVPAETSINGSYTGPAQPIPDGHLDTPATANITISPTADLYIEAIEISTDIQHPRRGELQIKLTSPAGTASLLMLPHGDTAANIPPAWTFVTVRCWGESARGDWMLSVADSASGNVGTLKGWSLTIHGYPRTTASPSPSPRSEQESSETESAPSQEAATHVPPQVKIL